MYGVWVFEVPLQHYGVTYAPVQLPCGYLNYYIVTSIQCHMFCDAVGGQQKGRPV